MSKLQEQRNWHFFPAVCLASLLCFLTNTTFAQAAGAAAAEDLLKQGLANYEKDNFTAAISSYNKALVVLSLQAKDNPVLKTPALQTEFPASYEQKTAVATKAAAYYWRARAWQKLKEIDLAQSDVEQAIALTPRCLEAFLLHAELLREQQLPDQAIADLNTVLQLAPNYAVAYQLRGQLWEFLHDERRAAADFEQAQRFVAMQTSAKRAALLSRR